MDITKVDKNFIVEERFQRDGLTFFDAEQAPFRIHGLLREGDCFRRLPQALADATNEGVAWLNAHTAGGRVRFATDSPYIAIHAELGDLGKMTHMPFTGSIGFDLYTGTRYLGTYIPPNVDITGTLNGVVDVYKLMPSGEREYTINFPLYSGVKKLYIGLKEGCSLKAAPDYSVAKPVVYYGSSITQGGCASRPGTAYPGIITRELDCDHLNLGFSGSARGEDCMAEYIAGLEMSAFVYDYDHNAPSPEHLQATHERMFRTVRAAQPELPIIMLPRPKFYLDADEQQRIAIVRQTYDNAVAAGDRNVYHIAHDVLLEPRVRESALVDNTHPTDAGFVSMAYAVMDVLRPILDSLR
ncbi:MAG: SGNH/GDSL hydrolase family protein [Clostridia bacterium]|nr:SGNH/GDSL hydrolase family protein [Clostridia bacterium]